MSEFTIVSSADDDEMDRDDCRAVKCPCGWRSVWLAGFTHEGVEVTAAEHAAEVASIIETTEHAGHV